MTGNDACVWTLSSFGDEIAPDLPTQLDVLAELGIRHLELRSIDGVNVLELTDGQLSEASARLGDRGFRVSAIASPIGKVPFDVPIEATLAQLDRALEVAAALDVQLVRIFSFYVEAGRRAGVLAEAAARLALMAERAADAGVVLAHENEKGICGESADDCVALLQAASATSLRAAFDPANFVQVGVTPYPDAYDRLKPWLAYLQVKDARFADGTVTPAGEGDARFGELLAALARDGFSGFVSLEPHLAAGSRPGGGAEAFRRAAGGLHRLLDSLDGVAVR